jgi:SAM-dependent methyltransferase
MNRLYPSREAARLATHGTLDIVGCNACGFAWNRAFEPSLVVYDSEYENDQTHSAAFAAHVRARAADVVGSAPVRDPIDYLEIGCGQGGFIREVVRTAAGRLRSAEGFDPAWRGRDAAGPAGSRIHKVYFSADTQYRLIHAPNAVASRHTIEHVPDPVAFLSAIRAALGPASRANIFIETPCITWILSREAMQDLFYEHCSLFTAGALRYAMEKSGFGPITVHHVFGGQYLWATGVARANNDPSRLPCHYPGHASELGARFAEKWSAAVMAARQTGTVAIWGAGAKGVTFALLTDPEAQIFDCAIDINPGKQGLHLAGSGLPVLSPSAAAERKPATIFVMNPNYLDEIKSLTSDLGINAALVPIN